MKKFFYGILLVGFIDTSTIYGIETLEQYVEADSAPPAEFEEDMSISPGPEYEWVKGHWRWNGSEWVKANGYWTKKPHDSTEWEPGYWKWHEGRSK